MKNSLKPHWVWYSTPQSFRNGTVSVLALIESLLAMAIYVLVALHAGTLHLTVATIVAPMLLLRTKESIAFALYHSNSFRKRSIQQPINLPTASKQTLICLSLFILVVAIVLPIFFGKKRDFYQWYSEAISYSDSVAISLVILIIWFFACVVALYLAAVPLLMRVIATLHGIYVAPAQAISNIPKNWWAQIACLDLIHPPELLPGAILSERKNKRISALQPYGFLLAQALSLKNEKGVYNTNDVYIGLLRVVIIFITFLACLTASIQVYLFRWSLKGTSVLLLPLVWLVYDSQEAKPEHIIKSTFMKTLLKGATTICIVTVGLFSTEILGIDFGFSKLRQKFIEDNGSNEVLSQIFPMDEMAIWQLFLLVTSIMTIICFLFAERLAARGYSKFKLSLFRRSLSVLGFFAVCTIFALVHLSASLAVRG